MEHTIPKIKSNSPISNDARVRRNRDRLRHALLDQLDAKPFEEITVRDLAAHGGVGYTTFFRHYPNKQAVLDDVASDEIARMFAFTTPLYDRTDAAAACLALCTYVDDNRRLWSALLTGGASGVIREQLLQQGLESPAMQSTTDHSLPPDLAMLLASSSILELLTWWLKQAEPLPVAEVADILNRVVIGPLSQARPSAARKPKR